MTLLERVAATLSEHRIRHALIGAAAMAVYGVSRSTFDQDLLVHDRRVLDPDVWAGLSAAASVDIRTGDPDDPLAGVVRVSDEGERVVDVVVGRYQWQQDVLERATTVGGYQLPVVQRADLILLKLYAGGSQDKWDIEQLLAMESRAETVASIDAHIASLPVRSRELWRTIRPRG